MSPRQLFSIAEKLCLQKLIFKYKLNLSGKGAYNPAFKRMAWARLVEDYNSIETNFKRTESQLKKCWDNIKSRRKARLAQEKKGLAKAQETCNPEPGTSNEDPLLVNESPMVNTAVKIEHEIDSANLLSISEEESDRNIKSKLLKEEYNNYIRKQEREEEVHRLILEEKRWQIKEAEEKYFKTRVERQIAEEVLRLNRIKREQAELSAKK